MKAEIKGKWQRPTIEAMLEQSDNAVMRAVVAIYRFQTQSEQSAALTMNHNGVGFRSCDAQFLTSLAEQILAKRDLTPKQLAAARPLMKKYGRQLTDIANGKQKIEFALQGSR